MRRIVAILGTLAVLASLGACHGEDGAGVAAGALPADVSYSRDAAIGSYRADLDALAKKSGNDFLSAIIADNTITADEMNEAKRRMQQCYADAGYRAIQTDEGGGTVVVRSDGGDTGSDARALDAAHQRCEMDSGYGNLARLYFNAVRNPDRLDLAPYTVRCLVDHGLVDPSYTVKDYQRDSQNRTGPYKILDDEGESGDRGRQIYDCGRDPLGKLR